MSGRQPLPSGNELDAPVEPRSHTERQLPRLLESFDMGVAIHEPVGVTYSTGGTASNKIYEYAAAGLPVVLYDSPHYREHVGSRSCVAFCALTLDAFSAALEYLMDGLDDRSRAAMADILESLNYQAAFGNVWPHLETVLEKVPAHKP